MFANGTVSGVYKVDLGKTIDIADIKTWSFNQNKNRGTQRFVLFGSTAMQDPGWDTNKFTPIIEVDTTGTPVDKFLGTRVFAADKQSVGSYRWMLWVVDPVSEKGEHTSFQEFQIKARP